MKATLTLLFTISLFTLSMMVMGCSSTAELSTIQTSNTYANKLPLKAAVYIPSELTNREVLTSPTTFTCNAWKAKVNSGNGYYTAIQSGLSSALQTVDIINTTPTPQLAETGGYDLLISVALSNENSTVTVTEGFLTSTINSQFQVSFTLTFADSQGRSLYSYTANGSGFNNISGDCSDIAKSAKMSMESALKQVADYIAQSTYSSARLSEYAKKAN